jgi:hypothetical protein
MRDDGSCNKKDQLWKRKAFWGRQTNFFFFFFFFLPHFQPFSLVIYWYFFFFLICQQNKWPRLEAKVPKAPSKRALGFFSESYEPKKNANL